MSAFRFASPWLLLLLPVAVAVAWRLARRRRQGDARVALPAAGPRLATGRSPWVRMEPLLPWLRGAVLVLGVLALARPEWGSSRETLTTRGVDIVVAVDNSGSMQAEDFLPNRLGVAKETVDRFVAGRPGDRVGLVVFATLASTRCPLTLDHALLRELLDDVDFAPPDETGTAIGVGLATAVNRLRKSDAKSRVVVLLTDGRNNRGQIGPEAAAEAAHALGIRVYTIGVGGEGDAPFPVPGMPGHFIRQEADLDENLLRSIARTTDGRYFRATDAAGLDETFATIDRLEKSEIESHVRVLYAELYPGLLGPAAVLLALELVLAGTRLRRIP